MNDIGRNHSIQGELGLKANKKIHWKFLGRGQVRRASDESGISTYLGLFIF